MPALIFIFVLGILVIIHEYGHFIVARWCGVRVEKFSIGFGPVIFSQKGQQTEFCVSLLPLGGFVKLAGESPEEAKGAKDEFSSKPAAKRAAVVLAVPLMNAVLAILLFFFVFWLGQPVMAATVGRVLEDAPAMKAGLRQGDKILSVDGQPVKDWESVLRQVQKNTQTISFEIDRQGQVLQYQINPSQRETRDMIGRKKISSFVGLAPSQEVHYVQNPPLQALSMAVERVFSMTGMILTSLGLMITGSLPFKDSMTGPIGIFFMTQQAAAMGILYLLYFMASLSVSLFVLNLLPIPVLDGGHLLFMAIERIKGSALKAEVRNRMTQVGLALLLVLMAFVIFQDINRFSILENAVNFFKGLFKK